MTCLVCDEKLKYKNDGGFYHMTKDHWFCIDSFAQEACEIYLENVILCFQKDCSEPDNFYYLSILDETGLADLYPLNDQNKYWSIKTWIEFFQNSEILI